MSLLRLHYSDVLSKHFNGFLAMNLSQYNNALLINVRNFNCKYCATFSDKKRRKQYRGRIERIRREQGLQEPYQAVTREEKKLIVKNMGFTQGHWFKCSYGGCDLSGSTL